jgi:DNA-directed RNA polymerase specialized sigma24 family protein
VDAVAASSEQAGAVPARRLPPDSESATLLRLAFDGLPAPQRMAIRLAVTERLTLPQIAAALGLKATDVQSAMREGLSTLRDVLVTIDPAALPEPEVIER